MSASVVAVEVVRWRCGTEGCPKSYSRKSAAMAHARICPRDPDNRSCLTCANYSPAVGGDPFDPWDDGDPPGCSAGLDPTPPLPRQCPSWLSPPPVREEMR